MDRNLNKLNRAPLTETVVLTFMRVHVGIGAWGHFKQTVLGVSKEQRAR